jgi:hypothetical protein
MAVMYYRIHTAFRIFDYEHVDAAMPIASLRRKLLHVDEGVPTRRTMYFATVAWLTSMPSFKSSPWIRGAPHLGWRYSSAGSDHESRPVAERNDL